MRGVEEQLNSCPVAAFSPLLWRPYFWTGEAAAVLDEPTPESGDVAPAARTRKSELTKKVFVGLGVAALLLLKFAKGQHVTDGVAAEQAPLGRAPTPEELEFAEIVKSAAESAYRLISYSTHGFTVEARFRSGSGRGNWTAYLEFDPETGNYTHSHPYRGATAPLFFGDEIRRRIREAGGVVSG
ncbi:hypothetical protein V2W30_40745 (plasmid) [Streptomyces sp. Q6]|uniref:Uncharacterized protein n=1 Tax=Streptomyces citrinus TaxID=3118173 RepID=A0ACD5AQK8_9ACTN